MSENKSLLEIKRYLANQFNLPDEQIEDMLPSFVTTLITHMENLESALAGKDYALIGAAGHTIKGAFLNLGLQECAEIALVIEEKGKEGDATTNFGKLIAELRVLVAPVVA